MYVRSSVKSGGTFASDRSGVEDVVWANPSNAGASDNAYAVAAVNLDTETDKLKCTNFGFALPADAKVAGIKVKVELQWDFTQGAHINAEVYLVKGGAIKTGDKFIQNTAAMTDADTTVNSPNTTPDPGSFIHNIEGTWGDGQDRWDTSLIYSDVNNSGFGCAIKMIFANIPTNLIADYKIDHVEMEVYYLLPRGMYNAIF